MNNFSFGIPQKIFCGNGSIKKLTEISGKLGTHALIISGPNLYKHGLVDTVRKYILSAGVKADIFYDIEPNPSVLTVEKAVKSFKESGANCIVALGGGSPIDVAKAVSVIAKYGGYVTDYEGADKVPGKVIPLAAIPTTAGTGSEVTAFSVITDHERDYKFTIFSYELLPEYAILDSDLIATLPASTASACGIDALIHAQEAYISKESTPFSDAMSEKAMELIGGNIRRFTANRADREAADNMLVGSLFAGIAFSFARLGNIHAMSHPISAVYDVPHGIANAALFSTIVEYNAIADKGKYFKIYNYINPVQAQKESFDPLMLADAVRRLCDDLSIPKGIKAAVCSVPKYKDITPEDITCRINQMAADAVKSGNILTNPRSSTLEDIKRLYLKAL